MQEKVYMPSSISKNDQTTMERILHHPHIEVTRTSILFKPNSTKTPKPKTKIGTHHLICIYYSGRIAVVQYGGHDGMPASTGVWLMNILTP
jgi:hypothetical protein